jgi:hypothetical protein
MSHAAGAPTVKPSVEDPGVTTDRALALAATAVPPAWGQEEEEAMVVGVAAGGVAVVVAVAAAAVAGGVDKRAKRRKAIHGSTEMKSICAAKYLSGLRWAIGAIAWTCLYTPVLFSAQQSTAKEAPATVAAATPTTAARRFASAQQAADALVDAAEKFDELALLQLFGPDGVDVVFSGEIAQDRQLAADFVVEAHEKKSVSVDPKSGNRAYVLVGNEDWPFPVPLVKVGGQWFFDAKAGRQELFYRRIGANELDAIAICQGYVDAQNEYAHEVRDGYDVNQYAQRVISTPGKQDGLAWQNSDGSWGGPVGEKIAQAIELGYTSKSEPYHGYFFKVLKGQGPDAPLGQMDFLVKGLMIGGFALVAAPAEYGVTGVKTFIVSNGGVVYEKDFGSATLDEFGKMELFNPDKSWKPVLAQ